MVGEDAVRLGRLLGGAVGDPGLLGHPPHDRLVAVGVEDRADVLQEHGAALETEPGVDVLLRQRRQRAVGGEVVLHEDEVPELEVALAALAVRAAGRVAAAVLGPAVVEDLGARPAGAGIRCLPEVLRARLPDDALARQADVEPALHGDVVLAEAELGIAGEHGRPEPFLREAHVLGHELPGERDRLGLEVVAEREVAEHLEERGVAGGRADVVEIGVLATGAHHLLRGDDARRRRRFGAEEPLLHRLHAGDDEQCRRVVGRRNQRRRRTAKVSLRLEVREKPLAELGGRTHQAIVPGQA